MCDVLDKVEKRGYDKGYLAGEAHVEAKLSAQYEARFLASMMNLIAKGKLTVSEAAEEAHMSLEEFERKTGLKSLPS